VVLFFYKIFQYFFGSPFFSAPAGDFSPCPPAAGSINCCVPSKKSPLSAFVLIGGIEFGFGFI
jgi:hypothetical protein